VSGLITHVPIKRPTIPNHHKDQRSQLTNCHNYFRQVQDLVKEADEAMVDDEMEPAE
jgi:hypothetical protein